jgi:polyhydroxyalkanoate synthesis regulator protein
MLMTKNHNIASFVLRFTQELWQDAQKEAHIRWRGYIRHVQGHEENRFTDFAEAVSFMQRHLTQLTMDTLAGDKSMSQDKVFNESFKMWEQFASSYTDMMFQAMEQSLKQSEVFREQVDEVRESAIKAWQFPFQTSQEELLKTVEALRAQVESLSHKVAELEKKLASEK